MCTAKQSQGQGYTLGLWIRKVRKGPKLDVRISWILGVGGGSGQLLRAELGQQVWWHTP